MESLNGIQKAIADRPSSFLIDLEKKLQMDLSLVLNQEEELWAMKSRINWMVQGDCNTSFYHVSTLIRRKHNKILNLKNSQGKWINDLPNFMEFVRSSFLKLFTAELDISSLSDLGYDMDNPHLSIEEAQLINLPVTEEEICHALWSLKAFKASGPDGLHTGFF